MAGSRLRSADRQSAVSRIGNPRQRVKSLPQCGRQRWGHHQSPPRTPSSPRRPTSERPATCFTHQLNTYPDQEVGVLAWGVPPCAFRQPRIPIGPWGPWSVGWFPSQATRGRRRTRSPTTRRPAVGTRQNSGLRYAGLPPARRSGSTANGTPSATVAAPSRLP